MSTIHNSFVTELSKLRSNSTFLTLKGYRNEYSEVSDYSIVFNISYANSLEKSIEALNIYVPESDLEVKAKQELIDGFKKSLNKMETLPFEELDEHYSHFQDDDGNYIKGVKYHHKTDTVHLYGFVAHKKVIIPGNYPKSNKRELTIVKDKLRKLCPVTKFRQFKIVPNQLDYIRVNKITLLPE
jgi:hypothetical protein